MKIAFIFDVSPWLYQLDTQGAFPLDELLSEEGDERAMNKSCLRHLTVTVLLLISLMVGPLAAMSALAQNTSTTTTTQSSPAQGANTAQTTSTRQTSSTTTTQTVPTQTTTTVDPLWIAAGVIGLLALLAIVLLAMRGRGRDRVASVRESTTVIKKD